MIKGGGYLGARIRQTIKKNLMWVRGVVCRSTQTQSLTVVACVTRGLQRVYNGVNRQPHMLGIAGSASVK